jgi:drug/metabolite transporter (DMT)-like permease
MSAVLTHTPLWVWGILALLIQRGLVATQPNSVTLPRLFLLPLVFSVLGVMGLARTGSLLPVALVAAAAGLALGAAVGWSLYAGQTGYGWDQQNGQLQRPGSWLMLVCSLLAFVLKFGLGTVAGWQPELMVGISGALLTGLVSGIASGLLWGASSTQLLLGRTRLNLTAMEA